MNKLLTMIGFFAIWLLAGSNLCHADELAELSVLYESVASLTRQGDLAKLEEMAQEFRKSKARTSGGTWKLEVFHSGTAGAFAYDAGPAGLAKMRVAYTKWIKAYPKSPNGYLAEAKMYVNLASIARGTRSSAETSAKQFKGYADNLALARDILEKSKEIASIDPEWYSLMMSVAVGQQSPDGDVARLLDEAFAKEPLFYPTYYEAAIYYSPRWGGSVVKLGQFAWNAMVRTSAEEGSAMYTRIFWFLAGRQNCGALFRGLPVDWSTMKKGMDDLLQKFPDNYTVNYFASFACQAGDKTKTVELLDRMNGPPVIRAWKKAANYELCKAWAADTIIASNAKQPQLALSCS